MTARPLAGHAVAGRVVVAPSMLVITVGTSGATGDRVEALV
jgi:hypothetical protein